MAEMDRVDRNRNRLKRAFARVLRMPKHRAAVSPGSILEVQLDVQRIVRHAEKLGWLVHRSMVEVKKESDA